MNLQYLKDVIIPQRKKEIKEGKNLAIANPIYVVYSLIEQECSGHPNILPATNNLSIWPEYGYVDKEVEDREFCRVPDGMIDPCKVTKFWTSHLVAIFLTSKAAHEYLKYQAHNLTQGYVYVHTPGYANREMELLLCI